MADNSLTSRDNALIYLAAQGKGPVEIAETLGLTRQTVSAKLKEERITFEIKRIQFRLFGKQEKAIKQQFNEMVPAAMECLKDILENGNGKPQLRFNAAQEVLDRSLGKPKQTVELEGSLIKDVYDKLDAMKPEDLGIIDVTPSGDEVLAVPTNSDSTEITATKSEVDSWIERNL